jgi:hypothetical protein
LLKLADLAADGVQHVPSSIEPKHIDILFEDSVELHIRKVFFLLHFVNIVIDLLPGEDVVNSDLLFLDGVDTAQNAVDLVVVLRQFDCAADELK